MKKHLKEKLAAGVVLAALGLAGTASGFPTWMGVYGAYETHDGANPGTYTILMNQDYWGLHAEVGIGIGGTWTTHAMEYAGSPDGNSLWRFRPGEALSPGTPVQYYFHGWDDWGGNIYANNGGTNYSFVAGPAEIDWIGNSAASPAAPAAGETISLSAQTWPRGAGQSGFALFSAGGTWSGIPLAKAGVTNGNDLWRGTLGRFPAGTAVEWVAAVEDGAGTTHYDNNLGSNYAFTVAAGSPLAFFGNAYHWPADGALASTNDLWLNVFASPPQALVEAHSDYAVNGWLWERTPLSFRQLDGTNEWWHADLGTMPPASTVFYAFDALDGAGNTLAFPASGIPRSAHVAGSPADADADGLPDDWEAYWFADASATTASANPDGDGLPGLPFDNWMERVVGTDPAVSNDVSELPLLWKPSLPQQGGVLFLSAAPEALAGTGMPAITATFADGSTATLALDGNNRWSGTAWVARTNAACTVVSFSGGGETDDNRGLGWTIPLQVLPEGEEADSDGDGMPDQWEAANGLDPLADDASGDPDNDGISNFDEYLAGLDPQTPEADLWWDFDGDGVPTLVEQQRHTDPADPDDVPEADLVLFPEPADWAASIAAAVATNPNPYTIVRFEGGTYATNSGVVLALASSNLVLVGSADPANPTVLDGQLLGRCVSVAGDNVSVAFLRFANGVGYTYYPGGAIYADGVRNLLLSRCRIENCFSDASQAPSAVPTRSIPVPYGAALYMGGTGGNAAFANTLVRGCGEGPLFAAPEGSAALRLANCTLVDNDTGPAFTGFSPLSIENGIIWHCGDIASGLPADASIANACLEAVPSCTNAVGVTTNPPGLVHGWRVDGTESVNVLAYAASPLACDIEGDPRESLSALGADEWRDTDEDGIPDWWETLHDFDPEDPDDADSDPDGDGLDKAEEYLNETPPRIADADGDGWTDGEEVAAGTDPLDRLDAPRPARGVLLHAVKYAAEESNQWVQLHCSGQRAVDVSGFRLQAAGTNWETQVVLPEGTWMSPGHFLLVGGEGVTNADVTAEWELAGTLSNAPTAGVRLMPPEGAANGPVDVVMYAQNLVFNENGLDTTGWESQTTNLWASASCHLERWTLGEDTDVDADWHDAADEENPANAGTVLDSDGDGLADEQEYTGGTNPLSPDMDGDGLGDGLELALGFDPLDAESRPRVTVHAVLNDTNGAAWVELYSADAAPFALDGFRLETGNGGVWSTVATFASGTCIQPGCCLLIGESGVTNRDVAVAGLGLPATWPTKPTAGVRLAWSGATNGNILDAVLVGGGSFAGTGNLSAEGWRSSGGVAKTNGFFLLERLFAGVDTDYRRDWTWRAVRPGRDSSVFVDSDGDGLSDGEELSGSCNPFGEPTDPFLADSDGDGLTDSEECDSHGTNPNAWATAGAIWPWMPEGTVASNWPGSDSYFVSHQLNPTNVAMTTNGFPALWEELLDGAGSLAPGVDTDGDGVSNADEVRQNSNPRDPDDSEPKPFVIRFEPTRPDWVNACVSNDIGFGGKVRVCFQGAKAGQGICIRVREGGRQFEAFTLRWQKAVQTACLQRGTDTVWYTSARLSENSALVVKDARTHPEYTNALGGEYTITNFTVRLVPDWDRNRIINSHDAAAMQKGEPFRFWINNDNDDGPVGDDKSDIPCYWTRWFGRADCNNDTVDGECDLLDFFPVWIDAADLLANLPEEGVTCRLRQDDKAVNAVYTGLGNANAGSFLTGTNAVYGPGFDQPPQRAPVFPVTKAGVELSEDFISWNTTNTSTPILLLEGRAKTEKPLVLEVLLDGKLVFPAEMPLSIESVENMYRWINLRPSGPPPTRLGEPSNYPDNLCNGKNVFFLHGFNVDTNEARAWSAEMFKRLYQSGSRARFWGMTWDGDVGFPNGLHYHEDVTNAFAVAADFAARLQAVPGEKIVLAHSLGNMVVSEAIQSNGLTVDKYFMLNAAVPSESYDTMAFNASSANNLVPEEWVGYTNVAWASKWHELFPANDDRSRLTWRGRFAGVTGVAYNYYSSQDEIFELKPGGAGSFSGGPLHLERYAWQKQEMLKGTGYIGGTTWAGWGMRYANPTSSVPLYTAAEANTIAATNKWHFCEMPLFWLSPDFMFASSISDIHRNEILGRGIPAMSPPTGLGRIPAVVNHSFGEFRLEGIWGRSENNYYGLRWKHSDIKNMAYLYIYKAFDTIAEEGALK